MDPNSSGKVKLPKIKFEEPPPLVLPQKPKTARPKKPRCESAPHNIVESTQMSQTNALVQQNVLSDRASQQCWDTRIKQEANEIRSHMTDDVQNIKSMYEIDDIPLKRLQTLKLGVEEMLKNGEQDPLFGGNDEDQPIVDIDNYIKLAQVNQQIGTQEHPEVELPQAPNKQIRNPPFNSQVSMQPPSDIRLSDITDFMDGNFEVILEEGKAVNELEVYTTVFDQCTRLITDAKMQLMQYQNVANTLIHIKNYFVNKITRKSQRQKAYEEATSQLDQRCLIAERDLKVNKEILQQEQDENSVLKKENYSLKDKVNKQDDEIQNLTKKILKLETKLQNTQRINQKLNEELKQAIAQQDALNGNVERYKMAAQNLKIMADQAQQKQQVSEERLIDEIQKNTKLQKRETFLKSELDSVKNDNVKLQNEIDEIQQTTSEQLKMMAKKMKAQSEENMQNQSLKLNQNVSLALSVLGKIQSDEVLDFLQKRGIDYDGLMQLQIIFQHLGEIKTAEEIVCKFCGPTLFKMGKTDKETQIETADNQSVEESKTETQPLQTTQSMQINTILDGVKDVRMNQTMVMKGKKEKDDELKAPKSIDPKEPKIDDEIINSSEDNTKLKHDVMMMKSLSPKKKGTGKNKLQYGQKGKDIEIEGSDISKHGSIDEDIKRTKKKRSSQPASPKEQDKTLKRVDSQVVRDLILEKATTLKNQILSDKFKEASKLRMLKDSGKLKAPRSIANNATMENEDYDDENQNEESESTSTKPRSTPQKQSPQTSKSPKSRSPPEKKTKFEPFQQASNLSALSKAQDSPLSSAATNLKRMGSTVLSLKNLSGSPILSKIQEILQRVPPEMRASLQKQLEQCLKTWKGNEQFGAIFDIVKSMKEPELIAQAIQEFIVQNQQCEQNDKPGFAIPTGMKQTKHAGTQVNFQAGEIDFLKNKVGELTRLCQENGLIDWTNQMNYEEYYDFQVDDQLPQKQVPSSISILKGMNSQEKNNSSVVLMNVKTMQSNTTKKEFSKMEYDDLKQVLEKKKNPSSEKKDEEASSSLSIPSYQHDDDNVNDKLLKYVQVKENEIATQTEVVTYDSKEMQTDETYENLIYGNHNQISGSLNIAQLEGIDAEEQLQKVPLFVQREEMTEKQMYENAISKSIKGLAKQLYNQDKKSLQSKEDTRIAPTHQAKNMTLLQLDNFDSSRYEQFLMRQSELTQTLERSKSKTEMLLQQNKQRSMLGMVLSGAKHFQLSNETPQSAIQNAQKVLNQTSMKSQEFKTGDIARSILQSQSAVVQSNLMTFADYNQQITINFQKQNVSKQVLLSVLDAHPRFGEAEKLQVDISLIPNIEQFQIVHDIDKIYLKYNPQTVIQNKRAILFPCILREISLVDDVSNFNSEQQINTVKQFKYDIATHQIKTSIQPSQQATSKLDQKFQETQHKIPEKPNVRTMLPNQGEKVEFVRLQSLTLCTSIPRIFKIIEKQSKQELGVVMIEGSTYIKIPMQNVQLKTLTWITKLCRQIIQSRLQSGVSYITQACQEKSAEKHAAFTLMQDELNRENAELLPCFVYYFVKKRYGTDTLILCLLWNIIVNLAYYQYESDEVYLFSRFFFEDLPCDLFLTYIESYRILKIDFDLKSTLVQPYQLLVKNVPLVLHSLLNNWEPKRRYALVQNIYIAWYSTRQNDEVIDFIQLVQIVLFAIANFKRTVFQMSKLVAQQIKQGPTMNISDFRQYCQLLVPQWNSQTINEVFFVFSKSTDDSDELDTRQMGLPEFYDMFDSMQLCRFAKVSAEILSNVSDNSLKQIIQKLSVCFTLSKNACNDLISAIQQYSMKKDSADVSLLYKKVKSGMDLIQCDIMSYDADSVIREFSNQMQIILQVLQVIMPDGCHVLISNFMNTLQGFLKSFYLSQTITIE